VADRKALLWRYIPLSMVSLCHRLRHQSVASGSGVGATPELEGWARAVGAYNAQTDTEATPLASELHDEFSSMLMWDREIGEGVHVGAIASESNRT